MRDNFYPDLAFLGSIIVLIIQGIDISSPDRFFVSKSIGLIIACIFVSFSMIYHFFN